MGQTLPPRVFPERTKTLWSVRVWLARLGPNLHLDGVQHLKQLTHTQIILLKFVVTRIYSQLYNHVKCIVLF